MEPSEPTLLAKLSSLGFTSYKSFPFPEDDHIAFYQAISCAIIQHLSKDYRDVDRFFKQKLWEKKLETLRTVVEKSDYTWEDIGEAMRIDVMKEFRHKNWASQIAQRLTPSKSEVPIWESITTYFYLHITWFEKLESDVITHSFSSSNRESPRLFISLAQEGPILHLLTYYTFNTDPIPRFPFYSSSGNDVDSVPLLDSALVNQPRPDAAVLSTDEVCNLQGELINNLLEIISLVGEIPAGAMQTIRNVRKLYYNCKPLRPNIDPMAMEKVMRLKVAAAEEEKKEEEEGKSHAEAETQHTIRTCHLFPGDTVTHNTPRNPHIMHKSCLAPFISPQQRKCNCPVCGELLPLVICNEVFAQGPGEIPQNRSKDQCVNCGQKQTPGMLLTFKHGCTICLMKCYEVQQNQNVCIFCQIELSQGDMDEIRKIGTVSLRRFKHS